MLHMQHLMTAINVFAQVMVVEILVLLIITEQLLKLVRTQVNARMAIVVTIQMLVIIT